MKYEVVIRTHCPAPLHEQFVRTVSASDVTHAQELVLHELKQQYPTCDDDHMWEVVSVRSLHD